MNIKTFLLLLSIVFAFSSLVQGATSPHIETKYLIELPEAFVSTLNKDEAGTSNLWHPKLTLTKVRSYQNVSNQVDLTKKPNNPTPGFSSFLQMKQTDGASDNLIYIPGGEDGSSVVKSSKMNCDCRFVKDPQGMSFIPMGSESNQPQCATSFIQKEETQDISAEMKEKLEQRFSEAIGDSSKSAKEDFKDQLNWNEEDEELKALLEKKNRMAQMEEELEGKSNLDVEKDGELKILLEKKNEMDTLFETEEESSKSAKEDFRDELNLAEEDEELKALIEKKNRMKKMEEELEAELKKEQEKIEREQSMLAMLEIKEKENSKQKDEDELLALLEKKEKEEELEAMEYKERLRKEAELEARQRGEDAELMALLERKNKQKELEEMEYKERLRKEIELEEEIKYKEKFRKEEEEKEELLRMLEKEEHLKELERKHSYGDESNTDRELAILLGKSERSTERDNYDKSSYRDSILSELRETEPRNRRSLRDKYQLAYDDLTDGGYDDNEMDDFEEFMEFSQKFQKYKSLLTEQYPKQKNRRWDLDSYEEENDRDMEDYKLLKKIKSVKDKSLREELIQTLLND